MIRIYGASDDLIEIEGDITEEFNVYDPSGGYLTITDGKDTMFVHPTYNGTWYFAPVGKALIGDDWKLNPTWPTRIEDSRLYSHVPYYSMVVVIATPPNVSVRWST